MPIHRTSRSQFASFALIILALVVGLIVIPSTRQAMAGLIHGAISFVAQTDRPSVPGAPSRPAGEAAASTRPLNAATLNGHSGLYFQDAGNLTGTLSTDRFSAYADLVAENQIDPNSTIYTNHNLPTGNRGTITGIATGLGLSGGGASGAVTIALVPGAGIALTNGAVTATLGSSVDLNSAEVVNVLPVSHGGTGLATPPAFGEVLVGTGTGYAYALLSAGDGAQLISGSDSLAYGVDGTVCRTSGNCASLGIVGSGTTNYLPKFTSSGAIGNSLVFDDGTNVGIGTNHPEQRLNLSGGTFQIGLGANPYYTSITENALQFTRPGQPSYIDQVGIGGSLRFRLSNLAPYDSAGLTILSNGNVGLGTTTPGYALDIYGTGATIRLQGNAPNQSLKQAFYESDGTLRGRLTYAGSNSAGNRYVGLLNDNADSLVFDSITATPIIFYTTNSERLRILAGGNIGIGAANPQSKLDVNGGVAIGSYAGLTAAPSNGLIVSGSLGIGQTSPGVALQVGPGAAMAWNGLSLGYAGATPQIYTSQTSGEAGIGVGVNDGSRNSRAKLFVDDANSVWGLSLTWSANGQKPFVITSANTEQLRLDTSGRLGLGTNNPAHKLELASATTASGGIGFGTDTELYRSAANTLSLSSGNFLSIASTNVNTATGFQIGSTITPATVASNAVGGTDETFDQPYEAVKFNSGSATTIGSVLVQLKKDAGVTDISFVQARLYSDAAGSPGAQVIAVQTTVYAQTLSSSSYTNVEWLLNGVITANTNYWIVFSKSVSGGNIYFNSTSGANQHAYSPDLSTWTLENKQLLFTVKGKTYVANYGNSANYTGVEGLSTNFVGVYGQSINNIGVSGSSTNYVATQGVSTNGYGTYGFSTNNIGAFGQSTNNIGVRGSSTNSWGLYGSSINSYGGIVEISGAATANNSSNALLVRRTTSGTFNATGDLFVVQDNSTTTGTVSGSLLKLLKGSTAVVSVGITGLTTIQPSIDAAGSLVVKNAAGTVTALQVDTSTGRVGIGTVSPNVALDVNGAFALRGMATPGVSLTGNGRIYFDSTLNKFQVSENAGSYVSLLNSSTGIAGSGAAGQVAFFTGANAASGDNGFFWDNSNKRLGLGAIGPLNKLDVNGGVAIGSYAGVNTAPSNGLIISGNVGIGTNNPGATLDVSGVVKSQALVLPYDGAAPGTNALRFRNASNTADDALMSSVGGNTLWIKLLQGDTSFQIVDSTQASILRVGTDGLVGINQGGPSGALEVRSKSAGGRGLVLHSLSGQSFPTLISADSSNVLKASLLENQLRLYNLNTSYMNVGADYERLTIQPANNAYTFASEAAGIGVARNIAFTGANLGIGTTSPSALLHLKGNLSTLLSGTAAATNGAAAVVGTGTSFTTQLSAGDAVSVNGMAYTVSTIIDNFNLTLTSSYAGITASGLAIAKDPNLFQIDNGAGATKLAVTKSGNLGLGTVSPGGALDITGASDQAQLVVRAFSTQSAYLAAFYNSSNILALGITSSGSIELTSAAANDLAIANNGAFGLIFKTNGAERARFSSTGNLGLGLTSGITSKLTFAAGTTAASGVLFGSDTNLYRAAAGSLKTDTLFTAGGGAVIGAGGAQISRFLSATATWDPPSVNSGASAMTTLTVANAALGDSVVPSFSLAVPGGMSLTGAVTSANTVTITLINLSGSAQDLASGVLRADVWQH